MTATALLEELTRRGAALRVKDGGRLLVDAPKGAIDDSLRAELLTHKEDLLWGLADGLPCPRCQTMMLKEEAVTALWQLTCPRCRFFSLVYAPTDAPSACVPCSGRLTTTELAGGWARLACACGWATHTHPSTEPADIPAPPAQEAAVDVLKRRWLLRWLTCKQALKMGKREVADRQYEEWHEADRLLRAALGAADYAAWVDLQTPADGRLLPEAADVPLSDADRRCLYCGREVTATVALRDGRLWRRRTCQACGRSWLKPLDLAPDGERR